MEDLFYFILFVFFVLAPLLERLRKKAPGAELPEPGGAPERRSRRAPPAADPELAADTEEAGPAARGGTRMAEDATTLVPDELWELLTGERRAPRAPRVEPEEDAPSWESEPAYVPAGVLGDLEEPEPPDGQGAPAAAADALALPDRGVEVSPWLEVTAWDEPDEPDEVAPRPSPEPVTVFRAGGEEGSLRTYVSAPLEVEEIRPRRRPRLLLGGPEDLRRAVILREVLGPPKGLE